MKPREAEPGNEGGPLTEAWESPCQPREDQELKGSRTAEATAALQFSQPIYENPVDPVAPEHSLSYLSAAEPEVHN